MNKKKYRPTVSLFDPGDEPHGLSIDLKQYSIELLKIDRLPSFRAILAHKIEIIVRGYGGAQKAAEALSCCRQRLSAWQAWRDTPARHNLILIDNVYALALELMAAAKAKIVQRKQAKALKLVDIIGPVADSAPSQYASN